MQQFKLTNNKVFLLLAVAAIAILGWGVYTATARNKDNPPGVAAPAAGGGGVQNVSVGDSVDFVVRDAQGNIKK